ncbi:C39 family peptidase [Sphingobium sp. B11D3D]|uniref:C39 family peptidase n=1 Tax=Sphingobium sp. B11D3D TaxID=2940576 RepID=UPI002224518E|nr:C39 family peptidase [Sphingobium sp. B11D3D]
MARMLLAALMLLSGCSAQVSGGPTFQLGAAGLGDVTPPVTSFEDRRFLTVVRQQFDFSCGSAALATLLTYHYRRSRAEADVFNGMWRVGDRAQITRLGFSLLDMKRYLANAGLSADGYKVSLEQVAAAGVPGIALIEANGYRHFVVVKGISAEELLIGDPALGLRTMSRPAFQRAWNGIYFVIGEDTAVGRSAFNGDRQWAAFSRAPVGAAFVQPLSQQALALTAPFMRDF